MLRPVCPGRLRLAAPRHSNVRFPPGAIILSYSLWSVDCKRAGGFPAGDESSQLWGCTRCGGIISGQFYCLDGSVNRVPGWCFGGEALVDNSGAGAHWWCVCISMLGMEWSGKNTIKHCEDSTTNRLFRSLLAVAARFFNTAKTSSRLRQREPCTGLLLQGAWQKFMSHLWFHQVPCFDRDDHGSDWKIHALNRVAQASCCSSMQKFCRRIGTTTNEPVQTALHGKWTGPNRSTLGLGRGFGLGARCSKTGQNFVDALLAQFVNLNPSLAQRCTEGNRKQWADCLYCSAVKQLL